MSISCGCGDVEDAAWYYYPHGSNVVLNSGRSRRCKSCSAKLMDGDRARRYTRFRQPRSDIEERIYGDEVPLAPYHHCPECAAIYDALSNADVCVELGSDLREDLEEFNALYAPLPDFCLKVERV